MTMVTNERHNYRGLFSVLALGAFLALAVSVHAQSDLLPPPPPPPPPSMTGEQDTSRQPPQPTLPPAPAPEPAPRPIEPAPLPQPEPRPVPAPAVEPRPTSPPAPRPAPVPADRQPPETVRPVETQEEVRGLRDPSAARLARMREVRAAQAEVLEQVQEEQRARRIAFAEAQAEARQERAEEARAQLQAREQGNLEHLFGVFTERLRAAIARLSTLANRLDTRIAAAEEETGERLTIAREGLDEARRLLIEAGEDVEIATMTMREVLASDRPRERFSEVREALAIARETLREAQLALLGSVRAVQAALSEE